MSFAPKFTITARIATDLMRIEGAKQAVVHLPITALVLTTLRETVRLLTTLILHLGAYDLKGLYSLEEHYASNLAAYYEALTVGPSHNYYLGRAKSDLTGWIEYFCRGTAESFKSVRKRAEEAAGIGARDASAQLRQLDPRQRKVLGLFRDRDTITSHDVERLFKFSQRTARDLLSRWSQEGFLTVADPAKKSRKYGLSSLFPYLLR